mmetsp:Transcript_81191/g.262949  ORF Transcript_81191/g.262949 Transcript_81191/m.262949 type:complete len:294 (-) Transcript_81191:215-1096(-)
MAAAAGRPSSGIPCCHDLHCGRGPPGLGCRATRRRRALRCRRIRWLSSHRADAAGGRCREDAGGREDDSVSMRPCGPRGRLHEEAAAVKDELEEFMEELAVAHAHRWTDCVLECLLGEGRQLHEGHCHGRPLDAGDPVQDEPAPPGEHPVGTLGRHGQAELQRGCSPPGSLRRDRQWERERAGDGRLVEGPRREVQPDDGGLGPEALQHRSSSGASGSVQVDRGEYLQLLAEALPLLREGQTEDQVVENWYNAGSTRSRVRASSQPWSRGSRRSAVVWHGSFQLEARASCERG